MKTKLQFYINLEDAWAAMYADCEKAEQSIFFEQYILLNDNVGNRFLKLFRDKARQGVKIRIVLDALGSRDVRNSLYVHEIRQEGGTVRFYNSLRWWKWLSWRRVLPRTHCKTMLIDGKTSYIGGVCIAEYMKDWRDLHIRVTGNLVKTMYDGDISGAYNKNDPDFRYLIHQPRYKRNPIYKTLVDEINKSAKSVSLCTPYFFPPVRLYRALLNAAKKGVDVKLLLSQKSDIPFIMFLSRFYFAGLLKAGVKIRLYNKTVMHAKYGIVDGRWATLGSSNLDYLSLLFNKEGNIIATRIDVVDELQDLFDSDFAVSTIEGKSA